MVQHKVGSEWDGSSFQMVDLLVKYTKNTWFSTLGTKINKVSNKIHQLTLRGELTLYRQLLLGCLYNFGINSSIYCKRLEKINKSSQIVTNIELIK